MYRTTRARRLTAAFAATALTAVIANGPATAQIGNPSGQTCLGQAVQIHGSGGNDRITVTATKVTIQRGKITETIPIAKQTSLVISTYGGSDIVSIQADIDTRTCLGTGTDSITAIDGSHRIVSQGNVSASLADGADIIHAEGTAGDLDTGAGDDQIVIDNSVGNINAGHGDDQVVIDNDATADDISMGSGDDQLVIDNDATAGDISMGNGDDELVIDNDATAGDIGLGDGDDDLRLDENATASDIQTGSGDDTVQLKTGALVDDLSTGTDDDQVALANYSYVDGVLDTGAGWDIINVTGYGAAREIRAGSGNDTINAGNGHNRIYTGTGIDVLNAGGGYDRCYISTGLDVVSNCERTYQQ